MARYALLKAVNDYDDPDFLSLKCAESDARDLTGILEHKLGFEARYLEEKTAEQICKRISQIAERLKPGDTFLFYFAGHGKEHDGDYLFLLPGVSSATLGAGLLTLGVLTFKTLRVLTQGIQWKGVHRIFVFDSCRAPLYRSRDGETARFKGEALLRLGPAFDKKSNAETPYTVLTSCSEGESAIEFTDAQGNGNGSFTLAFKEEINSGNPYLDENSMSRMAASMTNHLRANGRSDHQQTPCISGVLPVLLNEVTVTHKPDQNPQPASQIAQLLEDFERQLAASQFDSPPYDCLKDTMDALKSEKHPVRLLRELHGRIEAAKTQLSAEQKRREEEEAAAAANAEAEAVQIKAEAAAQARAELEAARVKAEREAAWAKAEADAAKAQAGAKAQAEERAKQEAEAVRLKAEQEAALIKMEAEERARQETELARINAEQEAALIKATQEAARVKAEQESAKLHSEAEAQKAANTKREAEENTKREVEAARVKAEQEPAITCAKPEAAENQIQTTAGATETKKSGVPVWAWGVGAMLLITVAYSLSLAWKKHEEPTASSAIAPIAPALNLYPAGKVFHDTFSDGSGASPDMVVIKAMSFLIPSSTQWVTIGKAFALGQTEVTVGEYLKCVTAHECPEPEWRDGGGAINDYYRTLGAALTGDNYPIVGVSWNDAKAYAVWLTRKTGQQYRLPSDAEWEYACRAGEELRVDYCGGDNVDAVAWTDSNSGNSPHPVAQKQANAWGLYDMSGNVGEWVEDKYRDDDVPTDQRVFRGGAWIFEPLIAQVYRRNGADPQRQNNYVGFRLARTLP